MRNKIVLLLLLIALFGLMFVWYMISQTETPPDLEKAQQMMTYVIAFITMIVVLGILTVGVKMDKDKRVN